MNLVWVGLGSFIGGILRYMISNSVNPKLGAGIPWGTLLINFTGCLLIGFIYSLQQKNPLHSGLFLLLTTGVLGGFTTFSSFSLESMILLRDGLFVAAFIYITLSLISCLAGTGIGIALVR